MEKKQKKMKKKTRKQFSPITKMSQAVVTAAIKVYGIEFVDFLCSVY